MSCVHAVGDGTDTGASPRARSYRGPDLAVIFPNPSLTLLRTRPAIKVLS